MPSVDDVDDQLTAALTDANENVIYDISAAERAALMAVYQAYDALHGQPNAVLTPAVLAVCRPHLAQAYDQVQIGRRLASLRADLLGSTEVCPYCGFGEPTQLDHFLPKINYGEIAIYPRNLVPCCGPCNNSKRTVQPGIGQGSFIHPYFEPLPATIFLDAAVQFDAEGALDVTFNIVEGSVEEPLLSMLRYQLVRLKLNDRYPKQINKFLSEQRVAILMVHETGEGPGPVAEYFTRSAVSLSQIFGTNDWRVALVRALSQTDVFCADPGSYLGQRGAVPAEALPA